MHAVRLRAVLIILLLAAQFLQAETRAWQQRAQNQEIEGASKELDAGRWLLSHCVGNLHNFV